MLMKIHRSQENFNENPSIHTEIILLMYQGFEKNHHDNGLLIDIL